MSSGLRTGCDERRRLSTGAKVSISFRLTTPADVTAVVMRNGEWLAKTQAVAKLLLTFDGKGMSNAPAVIDWAKRTIPNLDVVPMGAAGHHAPEDAPREIAGVISTWLARLQR